MQSTLRVTTTLGLVPVTNHVKLNLSPLALVGGCQLRINGFLLALPRVKKTLLLVTYFSQHQNELISYLLSDLEKLQIVAKFTKY